MMTEKNSTGEVSISSEAETTDNGELCSIQKRGWLKGGLAITACCAAPLVLMLAATVFGISLGALANGFLNVALLVACPVGMYVMMRMMMKDKS